MYVCTGYALIHASAIQQHQSMKSRLLGIAVKLLSWGHCRRSKKASAPLSMTGDPWQVTPAKCVSRHHRDDPVLLCLLKWGIKPRSQTVTAQLYLSLWHLTLSPQKVAPVGVMSHSGILRERTLWMVTFWKLPDQKRMGSSSTYCLLGNSWQIRNEVAVNYVSRRKTWKMNGHSVRCMVSNASKISVHPW